MPSPVHAWNFGSWLVSKLKRDMDVIIILGPAIPVIWLIAYLINPI